MADSGPNRPAGSDPGTAKSKDGGLAELREILVGPERAELRELGERIRNPSKRTADLSEVLADAVSLRKRDARLGYALQPLLEQALADSVQKNPGKLAEALFPAITRAVRLAVAAALGGMVESLNQIIETSFSWRSLGWRIEALRTGKTYAEVALLRSLLYRVDQVFLIQNETGLPLLHVVGDSPVARDPEMISGMLTAIQNFAQDAFDSDTLDTIRLKAFTIWIQPGPKALLAAAVRGNPPMKLRDVFSTALENIHRDYGPQIAAFTGDTATLEGARPVLEACLLGQSPSDKPSSRAWIYITAGIGVAAVVALVIWVGYSLLQERRWQRYLAALSSEPGIVVTHQERHGGTFNIWGLRDPLSRDPAKVLADADIPADRVSSRWEPYLSLAPGFVAKRDLIELRSRIEQRVIHFDNAKSELLASSRDSLGELADLTGNLMKASQVASQPVRLEIIGHTDDQGSTQSNEQLGLDRAMAVKSALVSHGVDTAWMAVRSAGSNESLAAMEDGTRRAENRRVSFKVVSR